MAGECPFRLPSQGHQLVNPYPIFAALREKGPVVQVILPQGGAAWLISRHDTMIALLANKDLSKTPPPTNSSVRTERLRRLVAATLTQEAVARLRPFVTTIAEQLLDRIRPVGRADLVTEFALPLSGAALSELFGVPMEDRQIVSRLALAISPLAAQRDIPEPRHDALRRLKEYFAILAMTRAVAPGIDMLTHLTKIDCIDRPNSEEIAEIIVMLIAAGHEPTVNLLSCALLTLLRHPEKLDELKAEPKLLEFAVQELIRYDGFVFPGVFRYALSDMKIEGQQIVRGDIILFPISAAGREAERFSNPNDLDWRRKAERSLVFGYGPHYCLGASLAMLEMTIAIGAFSRFIPRVALMEGKMEPMWSNSYIRALISLPVIFN